MNPDNLPQPVLDWLARIPEAEAPLGSIRRLDGSSSATLYRLRTSAGRDLVLRLFTKREWLDEEPDVPLHEAANLRKLRSSGLPVPELVALDPDGAQCGLPALLMTCVPGRVLLTPANMDDWLGQLAGFLPRLHAVPPDGHPWRHAPYYDLTRRSAPGWSRFPERWERAIRIANQPFPAFRPTFIHRDYHPLNVLFEGGRLCGVVDWPNACIGPAGVDVAHCRINLAVMYGLPTTDRFLELCRSAMGAYWEYDPFWDLLSIMDGDPTPQPEVYPPWLDFGLTDLTPALMEERLEVYLASVLERFP